MLAKLTLVAYLAKSKGVLAEHLQFEVCCVIFFNCHLKTFQLTRLLSCVGSDQPYSILFL